MSRPRPASALEASWSLADNRLGGPVDDRSAHRRRRSGNFRRRARERSRTRRSSGWAGWAGMAGGSECSTRSPGSFAPGTRGSRDSSDGALRKASRSLADALRKRSPCEASSSREEQVDADRGEGPSHGDPGGGAARFGRSGYRSCCRTRLNAAPTGCAALSVDRELTLKILELRLERAASPEKRWPDKLCPGGFAPSAPRRRTRIAATGRRWRSGSRVRWTRRARAPSCRSCSAGPASSGAVPTTTPTPATPPPLTPPAPAG